MEKNFNDNKDIQTSKLKNLSRIDLDRITTQIPQETVEILNFFKQRYASEYSADAGVFEGYTIEQHTLMVMRQFDKYFGGEVLPLGISSRFFKVILALHDVGKPEAIKSGGKHLQHRYTSKMIENTLSELEFSQREIGIAIALVSDDCIGNCVKGGSLEESMQRIRTLANERDLPPKELFELMLILYKVDAGSYTEDAGGLRSLDFLFVFDSKKGQMDLSSEPFQKVEQLRQLI